MPSAFRAPPSSRRPVSRWLWGSLDCASELVAWGDWGHACMMAFACYDTRSGKQITVEQAVRVPRADSWTPRLGPAEILCWGVLWGGLLRHPAWAGHRTPD
jgi:hypothetical protein